MKKLLTLLLSFPAILCAQQPFYQWSNSLDSVNLLTQKCDSVNNAVFILGGTNYNTDIDPGPSVYIAYGIFIAKYDLNGLFLGAATFNNSSLNVPSINIDDQGGLVFTANFSGIVDIDPGPGTINLQDQDWGYMVVRYTSSFQISSAFVLSEQLPGNFVEPEFDQANNMYLVYTSSDSVDYDPSAGSYYLPNDTDKYCLLKYSPAGSFVWAKVISSSQFLRPYTMDVSVNNRIFLTGSFSDTTDIDPGTGTTLLIPNSTFVSVYTVFITCYDDNGLLLWGEKLDGPNTGNSMGTDISSYSNGDFVISGTFDTYIDLDPGPGTQIVNSPGPIDSHIFLGRYDLNGQLIWAFTIGPRYTVYFTDMDVDIQDNIYMSGFYRDTMDLDPGTGTAIVINAEQTVNAFLVSYSSLGNYNWSFSTHTPAGSQIFDIEPYPNLETSFLGNCGDSIDLDPSSAQVIVAPIFPLLLQYQCTFGASNGLADDLLRSDFFVFPSPTSGNIEVRFDPQLEREPGSEINIYDISGRLVMKAPALSGKKIWIGNLDAGVYFISLSTETFIITKKVVLKK
jgi:hypothetical protein